MGKKNVKGGKKFKKKKDDSGGENDLKNIIFKEVDQEYGQVTAMLGNCRLRLDCIDGKTRLGKIRGAIRKKSWISANDVVLVSLREFEDDILQIIFPTRIILLLLKLLSTFNVFLSHNYVLFIKDQLILSWFK